MSVNSYQENSLGWQIYQLQQRIGEWWEYQSSKFAQIPTFGLDWLNFPGLQDLVKFLLWLLLFLVLSAIIKLLWQEFKPYFLWLWTGKKPGLSLPKKEVIISRDWLTKAEQYQRQGDYQQACLCLYQAMLQSIDLKKIVTYQASRTDGEYWSSLQFLADAEPYHTLLNIHQALCFGGLVADFETWQLCRTAYGAIENK